jgi:hypothetical protein
VDVAQALVVVLTFPVVGSLLAALTMVEKRLGEPGSGDNAGSGAERTTRGSGAHARHSAAH